MALSENKGDPLNLSFKRAMTFLCAPGSVLVPAWLLEYRSYGIDLTDENLYLARISSPLIHPASIIQPGFLYHSLYSLPVGGIAAPRQADLLITCWRACSLFFLFLTSLCSGIKRERLPLAANFHAMAKSLVTLSCKLSMPLHASRPGISSRQSKLTGVALKQVPRKEIADLWALHDSDQPRSLARTVMESLKASFRHRHERDDCWHPSQAPKQAAQGYGTPHTHRLYPLIDKETSPVACKPIRAGESR